MARPKTKEYKPLTVRMDATVYDRLTDYCQESGQPKTVAVERAITMFINDYEKKKTILEEVSNTK